MRAIVVMASRRSLGIERPCPVDSVGCYAVRSFLPYVGMAVGNQLLETPIATLSFRSEHVGMMSGSFDHDIEQVWAIGDVDFCTITEAAMRPTVSPWVRVESGHRPMKLCSAHARSHIRRPGAARSQSTNTHAVGPTIRFHGARSL